jgi:hypothetical protein
LKDTAGKIDQLSQGLLGLRADFDTGLAIHAATMSFPIREGVDTLRELQYCHAEIILKFFVSSHESNAGLS